MFNAYVGFPEEKKSQRGGKGFHGGTWHPDIAVLYYQGCEEFFSGKNPEQLSEKEKQACCSFEIKKAPAASWGKK